MRLKKIEILGFKSFADKTTIDIASGVTAIVGPNGCGKSNIVDALRWALGEQSPTFLRGKEMRDLIFSGTTLRKPTNLAQVTLTFTEVNGVLKTDFNEICVTRKLYRDGESEYAMNQRTVRLKDIHDLFLDSGISKNTFAIFEQGKIDQVINLSPIERRCIFEAAAEIERFLHKKNEACRRLKLTEQNMEGVQVIFNEVEKQLSVLEEQAAKAKIYQENQNQLERLSVALAIAKWDQLQKQKNKIICGEESKKKELAAIQKDLQSKESNRQKKIKELKKLTEDYQLVKEKKLATSSEKEMLVRENKNLRLQIHEITNQANRWQKEIEEMEGKFKKLKEKDQFLAAKKEKLEREMLSKVKEKQNQENLVQSIDNELTHSQDAKREKEKELFVLMQKTSMKESDRKQAALQLEQSQEKNERFSAECKALKKSLNEIALLMDSKSKNIQKLSLEFQEHETEAISLEHKLQNLMQEIKSKKKEQSVIDRKKTESGARKSLLFRLQEQKEGLSKGAKILLQEAENPQSPLYNRIKGLYSELQAKEENVFAVSCAAHPYLETLIVDKESDLLKVIQFAKEKKIANFSLFCLEHANTSKINLALKEEADNTVSSHFLSELKVAESIQHVLSWKKKENVWTKDNVFIDAKSVFFFRSLDESNLFLRERELNTVKKTLKKWEEKYAVIDKILQEKECIQEKLVAEKNRIEKEKKLSELALAKEKYAWEKLTVDREKGQKNLAILQKQILSLTAPLQQLKKNLEQLQKECLQAHLQTKECQSILEVLEKKTLEQSTHIKVAKELLKQKEKSYREIYDQKKQLEQQCHVSYVKEQECNEYKKRLEEEIAVVKKKKAELLQLQNSAEEESATKENAFQELLTNCDSLYQLTLDMKREIEGEEVELSLLQQRCKAKESELFDHTVSKAKLEAEMHAKELEFRAQYSLTIAEAKSQQTPLESIEKTEKMIQSLKRSLQQSTPINMTAIEALSAEQKRYTFLKQQLTDLTQSKKELVEIITELTSDSRQMFKETMSKIRENFKKNFQLLFNGGVADLKFTESADILDAGVDIIAKPPGKQMRSIQLLSGGEKCLTAIALLFSIFEVKPAPFCLLDEIDAPLDDTNVERFANLVKQYTDNCQFLLVTHNKRTMAIADRLVGVSMEEKGVSKLLTLEFAVV